MLQNGSIQSLAPIEERVAEFRSLMTGLVDGIEAEMRSDEGETIRDMSIAKRINNYCASLFENYRNQ